jgi:hypothetical protein
VQLWPEQLLAQLRLLKSKERKQWPRPWTYLANGRHSQHPHLRPPSSTQMWVLPRAYFLYPTSLTPILLKGLQRNDRNPRNCNPDRRRPCNNHHDRSFQRYPDGHFHQHPRLDNPTHLNHIIDRKALHRNTLIHAIDLLLVHSLVKAQDFLLARPITDVLLSDSDKIARLSIILQSRRTIESLSSFLLSN